MEIYKEYENFLKLNKLDNNAESANLFIEMNDSDYLDLYVIVDSYIEHSEKLKTLKAQISNLEKALKILPDRLITRLELARRIINRYAMINPSIYFSDYDGIYNINYLDFMDQEIDKYKNKYERDQLSNNEFNDFILAHRGALYTFMYFEYYDKALYYALKEIEIDENDKYDVISIIPYLYLDLNEFDEFNLSLKDERINELTIHLALSVYNLMIKNEEKALEELELANNICGNLIKIIANPIDKNKYPEKSMERYFYEHYRNLREDIMDDYRKFVIKNINDLHLY